MLNDIMEKAYENGVSPQKLRRFGRVAHGKGLPITVALERYLNARSEGNPHCYSPLKKTTVMGVQAAVGHLREFLGDDEEGTACLEDVTDCLTSAPMGQI